MRSSSAAPRSEVAAGTPRVRRGRHDDARPPARRAERGPGRGRHRAARDLRHPAGPTARRRPAPRAPAAARQAARRSGAGRAALVEITRPFSLTASIVPVAAAGALAAVDGLFAWRLVPAALVAGVLLQVGTNVINEVYDVRKGVDTITSPARRHALVNGRVRERDAFVLAYSAFALAACSGSAWSCVRGWPLCCSGSFGLVGGWGYTAPPLAVQVPRARAAAGLRADGTADGARRLLRDHRPLVLEARRAAACPIGLLVTAILHGNEWRDIGEDARAGIRTISISAGRAARTGIYVGARRSGRTSRSPRRRLGLLPRLALLAVLSMPLLVQALRASELGASGQQREIAMIDLQTAQLHAAFGALFVLGLAAAAA